MPSVFADHHGEVFTTYRAEIHFTGRLLGGIPKNPKIIHDWIATKLRDEPDEDIRAVALRTMREIGLQVPDDASPEQLHEIIEHIAEEAGTVIAGNGFKRNGHGLYIEGRQIKAAIKEAVNIHYADTRWGKTKKSPRGFTAERVFVQPDQILLGRDEPDGFELVIGHISGKGGKRATLTNYDYVDDATIAFDVRVVDDCIKPEWWATVWTQVEHGGLGAVRSMGYGTCEVTRWDRTS